MESKYNIENFERFLRERTDEFRMYPSKRVWYSIYNNMHPGNRMPSISMCIVLIFALLLIGYLHTGINNQPINYADNSSFTQSKPAGHLLGYTIGINQAGPDQQKKTVANSLPRYIPAGTPVIFGNPTPISNSSSYPHFTNHILTPHTDARNNTYISKNLIDNQSRIEIAAGTGNDKTDPEAMNILAEQTLNIEGPIDLISVAKNINKFTLSLGNRLSAPENAETITIEEENKGSRQPNTNSNKQNGLAIDKTDLSTPEMNSKANITAAYINNDKNNTEIKLNNQANSLTETEKAWIEDFAMYNKPAPKKWAGKIAIQGYITPSVVFRNLKNNAAGKLPGSDIGNFNNTDVESVVNHKPFLGIETGFALQYDLLKRVIVKAGIQLNYTRYNIHGYENYHPIATSLTMNSDNNETAYEVFRTTPFSNAYGLTPVKLPNESYQLSLPIGADFKLAAADKIEWYIGATIQPTIIICSREYLISTDRRNYVQDRSMLNRFNLNAGFETYISYKTNNYTWQLGPQFRSQIFSTNSKLYSVEERILNYGFKVGVSKKL